MTARTRIKVCGLTRKADADAAVAAGVDALGFIFVEASPRKIDPEKARDIIAGLPPFVDAVGLFMNESAQVVEEIVQYCGLTMVQLHGAELPEYCQGISCRVIKTFRITPESTQADFVPYCGPPGSNVKGFLLDTYHEKLGGGTGHTFDWRLIEPLCIPGPVILAGGLNPENIKEAILTVRPFAVDVNSGIEIAPGVKDIARLRQLVGIVRDT